MAHPYYAEKAAGFDQARHDASLSVSQAMRGVSQQELSDRRNSSCISPAAEMDGNLRNNQRRRVPVACGRCRKRKIKCSGDNGDGQACSNCLSANNTDCQFLRMNSELKHLHPGTGWPYPKLAGRTRVGVYAAQTPGKRTLLSMGSPQIGFQRPAEYDVGTFDAQHVFPRPSVAMDSSIHYEDEQSNYSSQSQYLLPNTPSGAMIDYGTSAWSPKTCWNSVLGTSKTTNGALFPDAETSGTMNQSAFNYVLPSQGIPSAELQSANTPMIAVTSADSGADRTLPTPRTCRSQQHQSALTSLALPDANGTLSSGFKNTFWNARCGTAADQRATSMPTVPSSDTYSTSPRPRTISSSSSDHADLSLGYLPMPATTDDIPQSNTALDRLDQGDIRRLSRDNSGQRGLAVTEDIYGYTSSEKRPNRVSEAGDVRCSASTLINGFPYTRVRHDANSAFSLNLLAADVMPDYHRAVMDVHRPSVSPLGHQGAY